jgi:predicted regulator of Ras-like GTPase activity (Roadblock/LC7/MglB family)
VYLNGKGGVTTTLIFSQQQDLTLRDIQILLWMVRTMTAVPKREVFERIIQNITSKFPDVYAALFISPEGFPINSWGVTLERAEEISALLSALIGKTKEIIRQVKQGGEMQFIQIQSTLGGIRIAPMEEFILVTMTKS